MLQAGASMQSAHSHVVLQSLRCVRLQDVAHVVKRLAPSPMTQHTLPGGQSAVSSH